MRYSIHSVIFAPIQQVVENLFYQKFSDIFIKIVEDENVLFTKISNEMQQLKSNFHSIKEVNKPIFEKNKADKISQKPNSSAISYSTAAGQNKPRPTNSIIRTREAKYTPEELYKVIKTPVNPADLSISTNNIIKTYNSIVINCDNFDSINK